MKKLTYCEGCTGYGYCSSCTVKPVMSEITICDTCGNNVGMNGYIMLRYNDTNYDFCGLKCLFKFIAAENAKETK